MNPELNQLLGECQGYMEAYKQALKNATISPKDTQNYKAIESLVGSIKEIYPVAPLIPSTTQEFHDAYNKNFDYLRRFTDVPQRNLKFITHYYQVVKEMLLFYKGIPQETIVDQGKMLAMKKRDVDNWLVKLEKMINNRTIQLRLRDRFIELLSIANDDLKNKGLDTVDLNLPTF